MKKEEEMLPSLYKIYTRFTYKITTFLIPFRFIKKIRDERKGKNERKY